jgi:hypothetical protein
MIATRKWQKSTKTSSATSGAATPRTSALYAAHCPQRIRARIKFIGSNWWNHALRTWYARNTCYSTIESLLTRAQALVLLQALHFSSSAYLALSVYGLLTHSAFHCGSVCARHCTQVCLQECVW